MSWPIGSVKSRLHAGRRDLRSALERLGVDKVNLVILALWPGFSGESLPIASGLGSPAAAAGVSTGRRLLLAFIAVAGVTIGVFWLRPPSTPPPALEPARAAVEAPRPRRAVAREGPAAVAAPTFDETPAAPSNDAPATQRRRLEGTVRDASGAPVFAARVTYHGRDGEAAYRVSATTDGDGRYALATPATAGGETVLEVEARGFATRHQDARLAMPRSDFDQLDVRLLRPAVLHGVVSDAESGRPVAGAEAILWVNPRFGFPPEVSRRLPPPVLAPRVLARVRTDASGAYRFECVPVSGAGVDPTPLLGRGRPHLSPILAGGLTLIADGYATTHAAVALGRLEGA